MKVLELFIDGACSGNPGEAAVGIIARKEGKVLKKVSQAIGPATNNIAEYMALIFGLTEAIRLGEKRITIRTDSELLYKQIIGSYKIKNPHLRLLYGQVQYLAKSFGFFEIKHIPREKNREADKLAKQALKNRQVKIVAPEFDFGEESPSSIG